MISALLISGFALGFGWWVIYTILSLAPWVPTRAQDYARIVALSDLVDGKSFVDLGSGEGRVCFAIAQAYPQVSVRGVELSLWLHVIARIKLLVYPQKNLSFTLGDIYRQDLTDEDVIFIFGVARTMSGAVKDKIVPQMKANARLISYNFPISNWNGNMVHSKPKADATSIYVYTK